MLEWRGLSVSEVPRDFNQSKALGAKNHEMEFYDMSHSLGFVHIPYRHSLIGTGYAGGLGSIQCRLWHRGARDETRARTEEETHLPCNTRDCH
jgi:hypothetical protein